MPTPRQPRTLLAALMLACLAHAPALAQEHPADAQPTQPVAPASPDQPADQPAAQPATENGANVDPAAKQILQAMSDAITHATSIRANIKTTVTGSLAGVTPSTEATVRLRRDEAKGPGWLVRVTGTGTRRQANQPINFDVAWGGGSIMWLDHNEKKLVGRPQNEARGGSYAMASQAMPTQILETAPFSKELAGEEIAHEGTEEVDAQTCDVLRVRYPKRKTLLKLWIAQSDHMLRKLERSTETTKVTSATVQELTGVALNQDIPESEMTIVAPDGYSSDITIPREFKEGRPVNSHAESNPTQPSDEHATVITPPGRSHDPSSAPTTTPTSAPAGPMTLPSAELKLSDGTTLTTDSLRGKPAVLFFWGSWSLPSRDAIEPLCALAAALKEPGIPVLACAVRERTADAAGEFMKNYQPRNRSGTDRLDTSVLRVAGNTDTFAHDLAIVRYPTLLAVDSEGRIVKRIEGFDPTKSIDEVRQAVAP